MGAISRPGDVVSVQASGEDADVAELARAFAEAIVKPGGNAVIVNEDNASNQPGRKWLTIEEALESGQAFGVEPCDSVLAFDVDDEPMRAWAEKARRGLGELGCQFVRVESGREGHGHLWVLAPLGWDHEYTKAEGERIAGPPPRRTDVRSNATRPPYAPHRHGGHSVVVDPGVASALSLFRNHRPQGVPDTARRILRGLDTSGLPRTPKGGIDRGQSINRAALQMVNARCCFSQFVAELEARPNEVTSKYLGLPTLRQAKFARDVWQAALKFVRERPPTIGPNRVKVAVLRASVGQMEWPARTVNSDYPVYVALLDIAEEAAKLTVDAALRDLAERAGVNVGTVSRALGRLTQRGLISPVDDRRARHLAKAYQLHYSDSYAVSDTTALLGGPRTVCDDERTFRDVFSNRGGLGRNTLLTWEALSATPLLKRDVAGRRPIPISDRALGDQLRKLAHHGFAVKHGHRWSRRTPTDRELQLTLDHLGVRNRSERKRSRHAHERTRFRTDFGVVYQDRREGGPETAA